MLHNLFYIKEGAILMEKLAQLMLDIKDDPQASLLKEIFPTYEEVPDIIKTASREDPEEHEYALVLINDGYKFKKFAMHDAGNTALSIMYFLNNYEQLPEEAVKVASENLIDAAGRFKLKVPEGLKDIVDSLRSKGIEIRTREKHWQPVDTLQEVSDISAGKLKRNNEKTASLRRHLDNAVVGSVDGNQVDVSKAEAPKRKIVEDAKHKIMDHYPVDTKDQVKMATEYFNEYWRDFEPAQRREYCVKLAERLEAHLMPVPENIGRYSSDTYSSDLENHVAYRKNFVDQSLHDVLDTLVSQQEHIRPDTFAEALSAFDKTAGIDRYWDSKLYDPYKTTFGPSLLKEAEDHWNYKEMGLYINERDLKNLANERIKSVREQFGEAFADKYRINPKKAFESLDPELKLILARMASKNY